MAARTALVAIAAVLVAACGSSGAGDDGATPRNSHEALCAGAPPDYGDGIATTVSCPWVQQTDNVVKYGLHVSGAGILRDATGATVATITDTCDSWAMGADAAGIPVLVRRDTGEVRSHGTLHPGQPVSILPATLEVPLTLGN